MERQRRHLYNCRKSEGCDVCESNNIVITCRKCNMSVCERCIVSCKQETPSGGCDHSVNSQ